MNWLKRFLKTPKKILTIIVLVLIILFIYMGGTQHILDIFDGVKSTDTSVNDDFYKFHISIVDCFIGAGIAIAYIVLKIRQKLKDKRRTKK